MEDLSCELQTWILATQATPGGGRPLGRTANFNDKIEQCLSAGFACGIRCACLHTENQENII